MVTDRSNPDTPDTIAGRLKQARKRKFRSAARFAQHIGVPPQSYARKERGTRELSMADLKLYAPILGVTADWLLSGDEKPVDSSLSGVLPVAYVPLLSMEEASFAFARKIPMSSVTDKTVPVVTDKKATVAIKVSDNSMDRSIPVGSNAVIDMDDTLLEDGKIYAISLKNDSVAVRRYVNDKIGARFEADSASERIAAIPADEIDHVVGRVFQISSDI